MRILITGLVGFTLVSAAYAKPKPLPVWPELGVETSILFPSRTIFDFEADDERGIWIEDIQKRWYYAKFIVPCRGLGFTQGIGFDTKGSARFDRSSAISVEGDLCQIESFVTAEKPLPRNKRIKAGSQ